MVDCRSRRTSLRKLAQDIDGVGVGDRAGCVRSGEKVFHSAAGALSGVDGECVGCWSRVVRHSVKRKKSVVSEW